MANTTAVAPDATSTQPQAAPQQAPQMPQSTGMPTGAPQTNPQTFSPVSGPSVLQMLSAYRAKAQELMSGATMNAGDSSVEASIGQNPWAPDEVNPKELMRQKVDHSAWLTTQPVAAQQNFVDPRIDDHLTRNIENDPALDEIADDYRANMEQIRGFYADGHITREEALQHMSEMQPYIHEALNKHHHKDSPSHHQSLTKDPDLYEEPDVAVKARAMKGGK